MYNLHAAAGLAPVQAMLVTAPLIPKPQGGRRPTGIFSAWQRVWGRMQRPAGRACMSMYGAANPMIAAGPGRSSVDPAWRTAVVGQVLRRAQEGTTDAERLCGVTVLLDISKFFDELPTSIAFDLARKGGISDWLLRCAFAAYSWNRHIRVGPLVGAPITPASGVVAGDGTAMLVVAAYMAEGCEASPRAYRLGVFWLRT